jgi:hypothetical protein
MAGSANMFMLFIVRLSKDRMNVGRKGRWAKSTSHYKSTAEVSEEQPPNQGGCGQTAGGGRKWLL